MPSDLFREQALDYKASSGSHFGKPTGVLPPPWARITLLVAIFLGALLAFLLTVDFARKESVRGKLRLTGAESRIYALEPGILTQLFVEDGQTIQGGQPIAEIASRKFLSDGSELNDEVFEALQAEEASLQARSAAIQDAAMLASEAARRSQTDAKRREAESRQELAATEARLDIARQRARDALSLLEKGLLAEPVYNERREVISQLELALLQLNSRIAEEQAAQGRHGLEARQIDANRVRDLADVDQRLSQVRAQMRRAESQQGHVVRAPISGRLTALATRVGEPANPSQPLAIVMSDDSDLIAEVFVPSSAIGFIEIGQEVKLQYDAFPYQKFGVAKGHVAGVSNTGQTPNELGIPADRPQLLYRVEIALSRQSISAFSKDIALQPGMELSAVIVLENRRLMEWVLEPLRS